MPLHWIGKGGETSLISSEVEFEAHSGVKYLPQLIFSDEKTERNVRKRVQRALKKGQMTTQQKWLGEYYAKDLSRGVGLDLTVRWIDERFGFGLWTNREIPALAFIGEYTGMVRRRRFWGRWKNHYCFLYQIGDLEKTPYSIDAERGGNYTRFINHSAHGNLTAASVYRDGLMHIILYASKTIPANTQLSYDYGPDYWKKRRSPVGLV